VQILVVDDASPNDDVAPICADFDRVRYLRRSSNGGVAAAQNTGLDAVNTRWVCFLHSDDEFVETRLDVQLERAASSEGAVIGGICRYDRGPQGDPLPTASHDEFLLHRFGVHISPYLFPTEIMRTTPFDPMLRGWEDWDLFFRLAEQGVEFVGTDEVTALVHTDAEERLTGSEVDSPALIYLYEKHRIAEHSRKVRAQWEFKIGRHLRGAGDEAAARKWIARSLVSEPWHPQRVRMLVTRPAAEG
jgi:glycosyltransferase involved in cell wall biosynthesis